MYDNPLKTFAENFVQWVFLTAKKWSKFWHPGFASRALRFKNFSETFSLSLLSLLSLWARVTQWVQSFAKM
jgi:hypothetical protein